MGVLDLFRRAAPAARVEPRVSAASESVSSESQWRGFKLGGGPSLAGVRVDEGTALSIPATLQALRVLTGVFAMAPICYYRRGTAGRERADQDALWRLLHDRPNSHQSPFAFKELLLGDILLAGNFYAYVSRDLRGTPVALTRLKRGSVTVAEYFDRAEGTTLFYDATLPDGTRERFAARDVWHVAGFTRDGLCGLNPVAFARDALGGAIATSQYASKFWGDGGRPKTILTTKDKVSKDSKEAIRADWKSRFGSMVGAEDIAVLDQDLKPEFLSPDNEASQYIETRGFQLADLARVWGVPPHLIFDLSRSTNNNIEQQSLEFLIYHLGPHFERVQSAATRQFAAEGHYFEFLTDALVRGDLKSRMEAYWLQRQMGTVNANELRRRENQADLPGDAGTEYWRPSNMAIAGQPLAPTGPVVRPSP